MSLYHSFSIRTPSNAIFTYFNSSHIYLKKKYFPSSKQTSLSNSHIFLLRDVPSAASVRNTTCETDEDSNNSLETANTTQDNINITEKYPPIMQQSTISKEDYVLKMYGRKGWICLLCNNFNFITRKKCNKCGITKTPKRIYNTTKDNSGVTLSKRKSDWVCYHCKNVNFSFRVNCNKCQLPKTQFDVLVINSYTAYS